MKNKEIFKAGDIVYHYKHGKGEVIEVLSRGKYPIIVQFNGYEDDFTKDGRKLENHPPTLSLTPYDLVNGGFSQDRPLPDIEVDTLVYVRYAGGEWRMRFFSHFGGDGVILCFDRQQKSTETGVEGSWEEWSLTNPLEEK